MKWIFFLLAGCITGCAGGPSQKEARKDTSAYSYTLPVSPDSGSMRITKDTITLSGTYTGLLPCASCEGIETAITLYADRSFLMKEIYKGAQPDSFINKGKYEVKDRILYLKMDGAGIERPVMYSIGLNAITQLDMNGNEISGSSAGHYVLIKN